jgi:hypothetical protein
MKKSLNYGIPAALVLAALAGCAQPTDDGGSGGGGGGDSRPIVNTIVPNSLYRIAAAFNAGQNPVYVEGDISLGNEELVIPEGKTLDFTKYDTHIASGGIGKRAKLILAGDIAVKMGENAIMLEGEEQKLVVSLDKFNQYVEAKAPVVDAAKYDFATVPEYVDSRKPIKVKAENVVIIQKWTGGEEEFVKFVQDAQNKYEGYLAITAPTVEGYISVESLAIITKYYRYVKLYILNDIKMPDADIKFDVTSAPLTSISAQVADGPLYNRNDDELGQIVIAGGLLLNRSRITLPETTSFIVKGPISGRSAYAGDVQPLIKGGKLTAYNANFDKDAVSAIEAGEVKFISSDLVNNFGAAMEFKEGGKVTVAGDAVVNSIKFEGPVTLNGRVKTDPGANLTFAGDVTSKIAAGLDLGNNTNITVLGPNQTLTISGAVSGDYSSWTKIMENPSINTTDAEDDTGRDEPGWRTITAASFIYNSGGSFGYTTGGDSAKTYIDVDSDDEGISLRLDLTAVPAESTYAPVIKGGTFAGLQVILSETNPPEWDIKFTGPVVITGDGSVEIDNKYVNFDGVTNWIFKNAYPNFKHAGTLYAADITIGTAPTQQSVAPKTIIVSDSKIILGGTTNSSIKFKQPVEFNSDKLDYITSGNVTFDYDSTFNSPTVTFSGDGGSFVVFNGIATFTDTVATLKLGPIEGDVTNGGSIVFNKNVTFSATNMSAGSMWAMKEALFDAGNVTLGATTSVNTPRLSGANITAGSFVTFTKTPYINMATTLTIGEASRVEAVAGLSNSTLYTNADLAVVVKGTGTLSAGTIGILKGTKVDIVADPDDEQFKLTFGPSKITVNSGKLDLKGTWIDLKTDSSSTFIVEPNGKLAFSTSGSISGKTYSFGTAGTLQVANNKLVTFGNNSIASAGTITFDNKGMQFITVNKSNNTAQEPDTPDGKLNIEAPIDLSDGGSIGFADNGVIRLVKDKGVIIGTNAASSNPNATSLNLTVDAYIVSAPGGTLVGALADASGNFGGTEYSGTVGTSATDFVNFITSNTQFVAGTAAGAGSFSANLFSFVSEGIDAGGSVAVFSGTVSSILNK